MPKLDSIKKTLVLGSGPIIIGQAAEFDYSGTQACQALKEEGIEVVLVNSNPATIMTDKEIADKIYIEPLTIEFIEKIIEKERPDSLLAGMGGQTGLNLAVELHDAGILDKYNVKVIGTSIESIKKGEDRDLFREVMKEINQPVIVSDIVTNLEAGLEFANKIGYPVVVRPAYTLGGTGGGIADTEEELREILSHGLQLSPVGQVLLEKSIKGWKEIEYEVMRDGNGNCITVCNMENVDPVGVHTGDSIVVAPSQTLSDEEYQLLRKASIDIINAIEVQGGCNVQIALNPHSLEYAIIEINPRVSRSSALASKATGYPIAKVAAKIALGYTLDEIENAVTKKTYACFEPTLDYVVVKIPKWPFDKFKKANRKLGTKMMATGEIMSIGSNFEAAILKGIRSLETGKYSLVHAPSEGRTLEELKKRVVVPDDERLFDLAEMIRRGYKVEMIEEITGVDKWFINKFKWIVEQEEKLKGLKIEDLDKEYLHELKKKGFSDKGISDLMKISPEKLYELRSLYNIQPVYKMVDTCGGEFEALSPYYYSTYEQYDEVVVSDKRKVVVLGSGPIRIGQGIEFDYCSVHCVKSLRKMGIETIIVNNNPETVSTDFDTSDKLYFEPLTEEEVLNIIEKEKPEGVILQFGGQTAIKLAKFLHEKNIPILGTDFDDIDAAEDREKFDELLERLDINRPKGKGVWTTNEGIEVANELGYPVLVRPSYVLGGQGMEITYNEEKLTQYLDDAFARDHKNPVLIDKYLTGREIEVDAICDKEDILIPGIMEHLERAGVHSGDSTTMYPSQNISDKIKDKILEYTKKIALDLNVLGMVNIQFIEFQNELYIIEVNPRASRTVPYISKVSGVPIVDLATKCMLGAKLKDLGYGTGVYKEPKLVSVKVPVFSMSKLAKVEVSLGPEMKSTGEVLGVGENLEEALYKGFLAAGRHMSDERGVVLATVNNNDKDEFIAIAKDMKELGYTFVATEGTAKSLRENGIEADIVNRVEEPRPNILDAIRNKQVDIVINTPTKGNDSTRDGFKMRRTAIEFSTEIMTSLDTLKALVEVKKKHINKDKLKVYNIAE
ncbi:MULTISPECIES: carbamoyl-phosphate synthase large subunit [unclassified Clostridioides]|uniref:carbamoyl-phosphate synthase large subunit n=5 Tax=Clostridioides TaxID=1870884 RepID=UPI001D127FC7|nr:carbamoyl-phosphate synthase large subunit [Clostridioides sp. ZZV14-6150]MCC0661977.1 carbamoyl-phosphate synthase large subunit [Clostridioides sp. ZZV14-6154]MCC0719160.1 carbamoyl-phosphate synthase large subunit [Clostridioides sp. ZZV14-6105]MCC0726085.1 carbamoyl-phosphate synthase large subunit [Clostridioides sp. ZZV14-6045]MCC0730884.1 carbamoyl-phosphate synthase large subunit [Clostridioides sp. ZZV14-6048]MCC0750582.1 carbamoyl-phosphate synthase large subunit [Clostridioides s